MENLTENLKKQIIEALNLEEVAPADFKEDAPLFGEGGLGLDSIDALELIVMLEKLYGIKLTDAKKAKEVFKSVQSLADFIKSNAVHAPSNE